MAEKGHFILYFHFKTLYFQNLISKVEVAGDSLPTCITNFGVSSFVKLASALTLRLRNTEC